MTDTEILDKILLVTLANIEAMCVLNPSRRRLNIIRQEAQEGRRWATSQRLAQTLHKPLF